MRISDWSSDVCSSDLDMEAFGRLFHPDATFVNRFATYWRGIDQIVAGRTGIHASIYRDSTLTIDVPDVDPISDDAAILHFWSRLNAGDAPPAGPHPIDTLILAVVPQIGRSSCRGRMWKDV